MQYIAPVKTPTEIIQQFENCLAAMQSTAGTYYYRLSLHGKPVGLLSMLRSGVAAAPVELGIMLLPEARGQGIADQALAALCLIAFEQYHHPAVLVCFDPQNRGALQLNIRLGFSDAPPALRKTTKLNCWYLRSCETVLGQLRQIAKRCEQDSAS